LENLPDVRALLRMGRAMVDLYCESFAKVPKRITLDIDDTFDAVHGGQQLRLFNGHYDEYGFQPIVVFDGEGRFVTAVLRPAKRPSGKEIKPFLRRLSARDLRSLAPHRDPAARRQPLLRPRGSRLVSRQRPRLHPRRRADPDVASHVTDLEASTKARFEVAPRDGKLRRFKEFFGGAQSWSRVERIIARVEVGEEGPDTRFVVTNLQKRNARALYEDLYCRRGQAENHIKSWKTHLAADRTSCTKATANQFRLFLHAGAYVRLAPTLAPRALSSIACSEASGFNGLKVSFVYRFVYSTTTERQSSRSLSSPKLNATHATAPAARSPITIPAASPQSDSGGSA